MKILLRFFLTILIISFVTITNTPNKVGAASAKRKIVVLKKSVQDKASKDRLMEKHGASKLKALSSINGVCVELTEDQEKQLLKEKDVLKIEDDVKVSSLGGTTKSKQKTPWGISKIKADLVPSNINGTEVKVAVLDSGIYTSHPDLKSRIKGGYNTINNKRSYTDDNGHGTHIAGIIAAANNTVGVVGVSPNVNLYAVKILDRKGAGYLSDLIEGIEWSINNKMQVINMSVSVSDSEALHSVIIKAYEAGIVLVGAAGNSAKSSVTYPAAYPEVISVSAVDSNNIKASFSSTGKVDICAPGVDIYSTYKASRYYYTMSGTSMAVPHVTGTIALLLSTGSKGDLNGDNILSPEEVKIRLQSTSVDLGTVGTDSIYGSGLVNAYDAVTR